MAGSTPASPKTGILLVNLGTPSAPTASAVRSYLREFLSDPRVVELPRLVWLPILYGFVLTTRPAKSAEKYAKVWTKEGSPLAVHTHRQAKLLAGLLGTRSKPAPPVEVGMRYGSPSIASGMDKLVAAGCDRIVVLPLYPQYAGSTTASVQDAVSAHRAILKRDGKTPDVRLVRHYNKDPDYIDALASRIKRHWEQNGPTRNAGGKLVMSFHGIPKRSVEKGDPYERECRETAALLAKALGIDDKDWLITFQSRFGRAEWLQPYTEPTLVSLAKGGLTRADVVCPGFPSDCLETLEELGIGAREAFIDAGGKEFHLVPCLNEDDRWIEAMAAIAARAAD